GVFSSCGAVSDSEPDCGWPPYWATMSAKREPEAGLGLSCCGFLPELPGMTSPKRRWNSCRSSASDFANAGMAGSSVGSLRGMNPAYPSDATGSGPVAIPGSGDDGCSTGAGCCGADCWVAALSCGG